MGIKINQKDLNKILKKTSKKNKSNKDKDKEIEDLFGKSISKTEAERQLIQAVDCLKELRKDDKIFLNENNTKCILVFNHAYLLSNNISLRLGARKLKDYKSLWHERVKNLVKKETLIKWGDVSKRKFFIEFCYEVNGNHMDYDGKIAAFKAPLDGLKEAKLIKDDDRRYVSMILGRQSKSKTKTPNLVIMLTEETDPDRYFSEDFMSFNKNRTD